MAERPLLCSGSPRRVALLVEAGVPFERGETPGVDETPPPGLAPEDVPEALAARKARAAARRHPGRAVVAADTVVILGGELLGKPEGVEGAKAMLRRLSGRAHRVVTAVAVARDGRLLLGRDAATVAFRALSAPEIDAYVATGEPLDKAGGYAIQGGAAGFVARREGAIDTIVGLPVPLVRRLLAELG
jgi:septum formation protein